MLADMRKQAGREGGFTLIELLVVMIIIAILMAVAIPTFLSQKNNALKTKATANIKNVVNAVESCASQITGGGYLQKANAATGDIDYNCADKATLEEYEKSLAQLQLQATAPTTVADQGKYQVALSPSGAGYMVQTVINDSNIPVFFAEIHAANGALYKFCGTTAFTAPTDATSYSLTPPAATTLKDTKTCKTGKWG